MDCAIDKRRATAGPERLRLHAGRLRQKVASAVLLAESSFEVTVRTADTPPDGPAVFVLLNDSGLTPTASWYPSRVPRIFSA
jgi:hypothetical protein